MPLGKSVEKNIGELYADNKKSGKAKGANGKPRSRAQIVAVAKKAAGKSTNPPKSLYGEMKEMTKKKKK